MTALRLDAELVRRGLARSRRGAADLVAQGRVQVSGRPARKVSQPVVADVDLVVVGKPEQYVSRAAYKLAGALDALPIDVPGRLCLDAGASTGGFTQVLLERGAAHVVAVDVGHDQIASELRSDHRVTVREGVNVRTLVPEQAARAGEPGVRPDLVVADLSFISLRLVLEPLVGVCRPGGDLVVLVKPQFEVGRERLGRGGVVVSSALRLEAVTGVVEVARSTGARVAAVVPSPLAGENGNREVFLHLRAPGPGGRADAARDEAADADLHEAVRRAVVDDEPARAGGAR